MQEWYLLFLSIDARLLAPDAWLSCAKWSDWCEQATQDGDNSRSKVEPGRFVLVETIAP